MIIDDVIRDLGTTGSTLPRASMQWALDHWEEAGPGFIKLLDRYANGTDRSEGTKEALFFAVHLLGEKAETGAFQPLCRLMRDKEACEDMLGDTITETLERIVISTYDGDVALLKAVIEDTTAGEFVRDAALGAMAYLARTGRITENEMRSYLLHLYAEMQPQAECAVWVGWVIAIANLGYDDYSGFVETVLERDFVYPGILNLADFRSDLQRTLDDPEHMAGFTADRAGPFEDTIGTFSDWYYFTDQYKKDEARLEADRASRERLATLNTGRPNINPQRKLGRNDSCPCGSGKKYKKCCLGLMSELIPRSAAQ
jgi:hypothetical protein